MSCMKPLVIQTESLDPEPAAWLSERCELVVISPDDESFADRARNAQGLLVRTYTNVNGDFLDVFPDLKVVGRAGVGVDNIDLPACEERGIRVVYTPESNTQSVVEYVTCLLCDGLRPRIELEGIVSGPEWNSLRATVCADKQMNELTLGILGLGRIGRRVAEVARAIGFRVIYHDLLNIPEHDRHGATPVGLDELLRQSDVLTIHIDGRPSNHGFLDRRKIAMLQDHAFLINASRGFVIEEYDLAEWLTAHPGAQASLDVHAREPIDEDNPLLLVKNARLLPHLASRTRTGLTNMSWVVRDVWKVISGEEPRHDAVRDARQWNHRMPKK